MMHIPAGVDAYKTAVFPIFHFMDNFWQPVYTEKFSQLLNQYASILLMRDMEYY
jgi:hypothetical protein